MGQSTSVFLRQRGSICAELRLDSGSLDKTVKLLILRPGETKLTVLLEMSMLGDRLIYSSQGNQEVLNQGKVEVEHGT